MPSRRLSVTVPLNGTVTNVLAGEDIEFPGRTAEVEIAATAAAAGVVMDVQFGSDLVTAAAVVGVESAAGVGPKLPDDLITSDVSAAADRLVVRLSNTTAGNIVATVFVRVQPI